MSCNWHLFMYGMFQCLNAVDPADMVGTCKVDRCEEGPIGLAFLHKGTAGSFQEEEV